MTPTLNLSFLNHETSYSANPLFTFGGDDKEVSLARPENDGATYLFIFPP